jgi:hypothetical protein
VEPLFLGQVLRNLLDNAVRYNALGGTVDVRVGSVEGSGRVGTSSSGGHRRAGRPVGAAEFVGRVGDDGGQRLWDGRHGTTGSTDYVTGGLGRGNGDDGKTARIQDFDDHQQIGTRSALGPAGSCGQVNQRRTTHRTAPRAGDTWRRC